MIEPGKQAYAKLVGTGWQYYMTKTEVVLGRGGKGVDCDVKLSGANAVSRRHFCVRFTPENEGIEVENMSKNGIMVNGVFIQRLKQPILVKSQTEITYGRPDDMKLTVVLPSVSHRTIVKKQRHLQKSQKTTFPLIDLIGHTLATTKQGGNALSMEEIVTNLRKHHTQLRPPRMKDSYLRNTIRHLISQNGRYFDVVLGETYGLPKMKPKYAVNASHRQRFSQFSFLLEQEQKQNATVNNTNKPKASNNNASSRAVPAAKPPVTTGKPQVSNGKPNGKPPVSTSKPPVSSTYRRERDPTEGYIHIDNSRLNNEANSNHVKIGRNPSSK